MKTFVAISALLLGSLTGCACLTQPSAEKMAELPVVTYPNPGPGGDFIYKFPAKTPITTHVAIQGTALASTAEQNLTVTLPHDLYVHKKWVSEDMKTWRAADDVLAISLNAKLPSDENPKPGEIVLTVDRKQ